MLAQVNYIPYRKKFHNLMEYFILLSTLLTLMAGLLLFVVDRTGGSSSLVIDPGLKSFLKYILPVITILIVVISNVVVLFMFVFDVYVRRKKTQKKLKKKRKLEAETLANKMKVSQYLNDLHGRNMNQNEELPWETEHEFKFTVDFNNDPEPEDTSTSMNQIFEDIFSIRRGTKKVFLISRAGNRTIQKFTKSLKIKLPSEQETKVSSTKKVKLSNGFTIKSNYSGNVSLIEKSQEVPVNILTL
jgi:hypothetical protein